MRYLKKEFLSSTGIATVFARKEREEFNKKFQQILEASPSHIRRQRHH